MSFDFHRLLEKKYPGYDRNHPSYKYGDILKIDYLGEGVFIENYPMGAKCVITKKTFGFNVGDEVEVPYTRVTSVRRNEVFKGILWKPGYVVDIDSDKFILLQFKNDAWHAMCIESPDKRAIVGSCYYIDNPYEDYILK